MAAIFYWWYSIGVLLIVGSIPRSVSAATSISVSTTEDSNKNAIEGFGTSFQCSANVCLSPNQKIKWYRNNTLISDGTTTFKERLFVKYSVDLNQATCSGRCLANGQCPPTQYCKLSDNTCCECNKEEYKLVLTNVSSNDSGKYRCQLDNGNNVEIRLTVTEGGNFPSFSQNLTFNHTVCCEERGMSSECMPMCRPSLIETHKFDPIPCQKEFSKLLHCATEGGNISHTHCCRLHFVPAFCWEYCSGTSVDFSRANKLCFFWMPEIFQCYEQAYLPLPGPPEGLIVNSYNSTALEACWDQPERNSESIRFYSVRFQEVPRFPLLGGAIPFMTSDGDLPSDGDTASAVEEEAPGDFETVSMNGGHKVINGRKKRQTLVITTHNFATNETEVREYRYSEVNTTDTCSLLTNLRPSTQYFVYVTATNDYGVSLPSLRQTALTEPVIYPNATLPNVHQCCVDKKVESVCLPKMCDIEHPPTSVNAFDLAFSCRTEFPSVSPCLADGRDHTECCKEKGVVGECLKFCDGSVTQMGMSGVLCLSLDIQQIFSCFREGYVKLPSPPTNVTIKIVDASSVEVVWSPPSINDEKVANYSLFYRQSYLSQYIEVTNVKSPYSLVNLQSDSTYSAYLVARSPEGSSLKSTVVSFTTSEPVFENVCEYGKPLLDAFGKPLRCSLRLQCPESHKCVDSETDDPDLKYCCPIDGKYIGPTVRVVQPNVTACCEQKGVEKDCLNLCSYKTTQRDLLHGDLKCAKYVEAFIGCGNDERNDYPCCVKAGVTPELCLDFCRPPLLHKQLEDYLPCIINTEKIIQCALEGALNLPGPPINVTIEDEGPTWVTLHWKRPRQSPTVDRYEILFNNITMGNTTGLSTTVSGLETNKLFVVHVVAWNGRGSSLPTEGLNITLKNDAAESQDKFKPRPPWTIRKAWFKDGTANVTWQWNPVSVAGNLIDRYQFQVLYRVHKAPEDARSTGAWQNVSSTLRWAFISNLTANATYDIKVSAINVANGVEGLFSETIPVTMSNAPQQPMTLDLRVDPSGPLRNGTRATVTCIVNGWPDTLVTLTKGGRHLSKGLGSTTFIFGILRPNDGSEPLICEANNGESIITKKEVLKVQFIPVVTAQVTPISSYEDLVARFACRVQGYPETKTYSWFFSSPSNPTPKQIVEENHYRMEISNTNLENVFNSTMTIENTRMTDGGVYTCKACNDLGCSNATITLNVEQLPEPKNPEYIYDCCQKAKVKPQCMSACTSEMDINAYDQNIDCISEFPKFLACAKDGIDNRHCCVDSRVPEICLPYCDGSRETSGDVFSKMNECSKYENQILKCMVDGHKALPLPPQSLSVVPLDDGRVNVSWKVPASVDDHIQLYVLYYKSPKDKTYSEVRTDKPFALVGPLQPNVVYNFTAIAKNHYGWSSFAPQYSSSISSSARSSSSAGVVLGVIFCLLLAVVVILAFVYFSRRPYKLPTFLLKLTSGAKHDAASGAVAFENPGYDKEGQVRGLPGDHDTNGQSSSNDPDVGWEHARLETPNESPSGEQRGLRYAPLS